MGDFDGRTALVTGAGSGIGRAVVLGLAREGAAVVVQDLNQAGADAVVAEVEELGAQAIAVVGDASDPALVRDSVAAAVDTYGALHLAVNNAGIRGPRGSVGDFDDSDGFAEYRNLMAVNLDSVFYGMRYEIPAILNAGGGSIVNVASILGLVGRATAAPYTAAKHGVAGLTKAAAAEYSGQGIRINSVHPGYIDTPLLTGVTSEGFANLVALHPIGRLGTAEEVANLVLFLLSDKASFISGSQHVIDGGYTAV